MHHYLFIAVGGALGALARYGVTTTAHSVWGASWPAGTLLVNGAGSFLIGVVFALLEKSALHPDWRSILMVGFLGAFTTFSTYSLETVELWSRGHGVQAVAYALGSVVVCVSAAACGLGLIRALAA